MFSHTSGVHGTKSSSSLTNWENMPEKTCGDTTETSAMYWKTVPNVHRIQNKVYFSCLLYNLPLKRVPVFDVFLPPLDMSYTYFSLKTNRQGSLHSNQVIYMALLLVIITTEGKGCIPEEAQRTIAEINWPLRPKRQIVTKIEELKGWLAF